MALSTAEVHQIARLANLSLDAGEVESLARDLGSILDHMTELEGADLAGVAPTGGVSEHSAPMREDEPGADPLRIGLDEVAPRLEEGLFVVPRLAALDADAVPETSSP